MEKQAQNIQEAFLNNARKDKTFLTIYLMSGVKLSGRIKSFDKYSVILETNNQEQLIFKHAISTVVVSKPFHSPAHSNSASVGAPGGPGVPVTDSEWPKHFPMGEEVAILVGLHLTGRTSGTLISAEDSMEELVALAMSAAA